MIAALLEPYVDGWIGPMGNELTVVPRAKFPFKDNPTSDTYSRLYERDYEVNPRALPRVPARTAWTNLLTYSEDFDNAAWTKTNLSVTANNTTAPDGLATMDKLLESSATGEHSVSQAVTVTAAAHEVMFFIKGGLTRTWVRAAFTDSAATVRSAFFSTSGYVISPSSGTTAKIFGLGNGHFACVLRGSFAAGAGTLKINTSTDGSTISFAGSTTAGVYLWGAQVVLGSVAPYISTTSAARSILAPDRDPRDPMAYLLHESDPEPINSHKERVTRTFGRIPLQQTLPGSRWVTKPPIAGPFPRVINGSLVTQPDSSVPSFSFFSRSAVTSDSGPPSVAYPTGGTYAVTAGANTTAGQAYNVSAGTLGTAINGLAAISNRGSVTVSGAYNTAAGFSIAIAAYAAGSTDYSLLTNSGSVQFGHVELSRQTATGYDLYLAIGFVQAGVTITGGTFTVTIFGQTTAALAHNCSAATLLAAIQGLSNVGASATISLAYNQTAPLWSDATAIEFTVHIPVPAISVNGVSLTPAGSTASVNAGVHTKALTFTGVSPAVRQIYAANHGIVPADNIVVTQGGNLTLASGQFTVLDSNTIQFTSAAGVVFSSATAISFVGKASSSSAYVAGPKNTRCNFITDYYLIGVTPGISSTLDVPIPEYDGADADLLAAIFAGETSINIDTGTLKPYQSTPILERTVEAINAALL